MKERYVGILEGKAQRAKGMTSTVASSTDPVDLCDLLAKRPVWVGEWVGGSGR